MFSTLFARPAVAIGPHLQAFVAYEAERPIATGTLFLTHGVTYIGWIGTAREHGRRGLGSSLTAWLVNRGHSLGAHGSVLLASPMGAPIYRRLGFVDVGGLQRLSTVRRFDARLSAGPPPSRADHRQRSTTEATTLSGTYGRLF